MKKAKILAAALAVALSVGMCGCGVLDFTDVRNIGIDSNDFAIGNNGDDLTSAELEELDQTEGYQVGNGSATTVIDTLVVDWVSEDVVIQYGDVDYIQLEETSKDTLTNKQRMRYKEENGSLYVWYQTPSIINIEFGESIKKKLIITLPRDSKLSELNISSVSADISLPQELIVDSLIIDAVSGDVETEGIAYIKNIEMNLVSSDVELKLAEAEHITIDAVSGDLELGLASNIGFEVNMDAIGGEFTSDFPVTVKDDIYTSGDGSLKIEMDSVSGDIEIYQLD